MSIAYIATYLDGKLINPIYNREDLIITDGIEVSIPVFLNGAHYFSNGVIRLYTNSVLAMLLSMHTKKFGEVRLFKVECDTVSNDPRRPFCVAAKQIKVLNEIDLPLSLARYNISILSLAEKLAQEYLDFDVVPIFKQWLLNTKSSLISNNNLDPPNQLLITAARGFALISWCFDIIYHKDYSNTAPLVLLGLNVDLVKELDKEQVL